MIEKNKVYLIGEIGINHNADLQIAKKLIDSVWACEWDCVKFQKKHPPSCIPDNQKDLVKETPWGTMSYLEYKKKLEFGFTEYIILDDYCKEKPIDWTCSVWDIPSVGFMKSFPARPFIKIPSAKITDLELVEAIAKSGTTVILSTGMSTMKEVRKAVSIVDDYTECVIMHCNSSYPAPVEDLNLNMITTFKKEFPNHRLGYSGHEYGIEPTITAVVLGATVIERHITLSHDMWGTDQSASLEIEGMFILKNRIKTVLNCLGDGIKRITKKELEVMKKLRGE
jgi:N-acetylneuraminate synthase